MGDQVARQTDTFDSAGIARHAQSQERIGEARRP
jgi:hypothetical protein